MAFPDQVAACDVDLRRASHRAFRVKKKFDIEMQRHNRMIVGWSIDGRTTREFLIIRCAWRVSRKPAPVVLHYCNSSSQYCSGDCGDNAPMESFFNSLTNQQVFYED
jgi:putative transposase